MFNWIKSKKSLTINQTSNIEFFLVTLFALSIIIFAFYKYINLEFDLISAFIITAIVIIMVFLNFRCKLEYKMKIYDSLYFISAFLIINLVLYLITNFIKLEFFANDEEGHAVLSAIWIMNSMIIFFNILSWSYKMINCSEFGYFKKLFYKIVNFFALYGFPAFYYRHKIIVFIIIYCPINLFLKNNVIFFGLIYCLLTQIAMLMCRPNLYPKTVTITQSNLDLEDIKRGNLYSLDDQGILGKSSTIKVDMSDFMKDYELKDCCVVVSNLKCTNNLRSAAKYFYLAIPEKFNMDFVQIKAYITYKNIKTEEIIETVEFMLEIRTIDSFKFVISRYINRNYKLKYFKKSILKVNSCQPNFIFNSNKIECKYEHLFINLYKFNDNDISQFKDLIISDKRKFLLHNDKLGVGKTTYDMNFIMSQGYLPIVISSWEDNYDHDFLYYIFTRVKEETKTYSHATIKGISVFYVTLLSSILTLYLVNRKSILSMIPQTVWNSFEKISGNVYLVVFKNEILSVSLAILFISIILFAFFNYSIIIFKKDYSKVYQRFFLTEIYKMIHMHGKILLLIEDADRLNVVAFDNVIRTLSSINKKFMKYNTILGILSIDVDDLTIKLNKAKEMLGCNMYDIRNKIICNEIGKEYDTKLCMKLYLTDIFEFIKNKNSETNYIALSVLETQSIEDYLAQENINFRDVLEVINMIINNYTNICCIDNALAYLGAKKKS